MYVPVCSACESPFQSTLPRRERRPRRSARSLPRNFNPRSREGSDACVPGLWISSSDFNPRSREGSDLVRSSTDSSSQHFNPRSREGSDGTDLVLYLACNISIHAPAKGATRANPYICDFQYISIHAPAKGATAKITKTIPNDLRKINNYNNSFTQICAKHNCKFDIR